VIAKVEHDARPCRHCGRDPVVIKVKPRHFRVACPYLDCEYVNSYGETEAEAIRKWNAEHGEEIER
jgi:hypothetical protein